MGSSLVSAVFGVLVEFWSVFYVSLDVCSEGTFCFKGLHFYAEMNKYSELEGFLRICIWN